MRRLVMFWAFMLLVAPATMVWSCAPAVGCDGTVVRGLFRFECIEATP